MKKFSKRLLTFVLACAMVFGLSGMTAFAAEADDTSSEPAAISADAASEPVELADESASEPVAIDDDITYEDIVVYKQGKEVGTITGDEFAAAEAAAPEQTFVYYSGSGQSTPTEVKAKFVLVSTLLADFEQQPDGGCGISIPSGGASRGGQTYEDWEDSVYIYYDTDNGAYRSAVDETVGGYWVSGLTSIVLGHDYNNGPYCVICGAVNEDYKDEGGGGIVDDYEPEYSWYNESREVTEFHIKTVNQLAALSEIVNGTSDLYSQNSFRGQTVYLDNDLNMNTEGSVELTYDFAGEKGKSAVTTKVALGDYVRAFTPIGNMRYGSDGRVESGHAFEGTFDGQGNTIKNLYVTGDEYVGLFGAVGDAPIPGEEGYGVIKNFNVTGVVECTGDGLDFAAGVCAKLNAGGTIQNVINYAAVEAPNTFNVGGVVGFAGTNVKYGDTDIYDAYKENPSGYNTYVLCCGNEATIHGYYKQGGIAGENAATLMYCYNTGWILPHATYRNGGWGGIVGRNGNNNTACEESIVAYCYNTGTISNNGYNDDYTDTVKGYAGIVGQEFGALGKNEVHNCYNIGSIPVGYNRYNSVLSGPPEGAAVAVLYDNYTLYDPDRIHNYVDTEEGIDTAEMESGISVTEEEFMSTDYGNDDILTKLGPYFRADKNKDINGGYPVLWWQVKGETEPEIESLTIQTGATKTSYTAGELFDPTGMVVVATYQDGIREIVPVGACIYDDMWFMRQGGYSFKTDPLTGADKEIEVSYKGLSDKQAITVEGSTLDGITVTAPDKTIYSVGDYFDPTGMTITASFNDGAFTTKLSTDQVSYSPGLDHPLELTDTTITVTYEMDGQTKSASVTITVSNEPKQDDEGRYLLSNVGEVEWFSDQVTTKGNTDIDAVLTNDIDISGSESFLPIGDYSNPYTGNFDGAGYTLTVDIDIGDRQADHSVSFNSLPSGVIGYMVGGTVSNLTVDGCVHSKTIDAGIVGYAVDGSITNCVNNAEIMATSTDVGGIVAWNEGKTKIKDCINNGTIVGQSYTGGIVGRDDGNCTITNCVNTAAITGLTWTGGIVGRMKNSSGSIADCGNEGTVTSAQPDTNTGYIGGIVGEGYSNISGCYNKGDVLGNNCVGGIVGSMCAKKMDDCYNTGTVTAYYDGDRTYYAAGGIAGYTYAATTYTNVFNMGDVSATYAGALLGSTSRESSNAITLSNAYYLAGTAENPYNVYDGGGGVTENSVFSSKTAEEIASEEFLGLINGDSAFKKGCQYPVLTWETKIQHTWGEVKWEWSEDYSSATATRTCSACGETETVEAVVTSNITKEPTTSQEGSITYTATAIFGDGTEETDTKTAVIPKLVAPTVSVTVTTTLTGGSKTYDGAGVSLTATAVSTPDTAVVSYQWYKDDEAISGANYNLLNLDGNVTDSGTYKCVVTATNDGLEATDSAAVTITIEKAAQDISYEEKSIDKFVGDEAFTNPLTETTLSTEEGAGITYASSDASVATVDESTGEVSILAEGETTITATAAGTANYAEATASYTITVAKKLTASVTVTSTLTDNTKTYDGNGVSLTANTAVEPDDAEYAYQWYKDDKAIAGANSDLLNLDGDVSDSGTYKCVVSASYDTQTAEAEDAITITIEKAKQTISYERTLVTKYDYDEDFTNELTKTTVFGQITYTSSNPDVATVNADTGEVSIKGTGNTTITATVPGNDNYEEATAFYVLVVNTDKIEWEIDVNHDQVTWDEDKGEYFDDLIYNGDDLELELALTLDEDDVETISHQWYRYNAYTLEFDEITGATDDTYTLTGEAVNAGDYLYMCVSVVTYKSGYQYTVSSPIEIIIEKAKQAISYEVTSLNKTVGDAPFTNDLTETKVDTEGGAAITYASSDESIATVDANGEVTILTVGEVTITATASETTNYEAATASYTITIATDKAALQEEYDEDCKLSEEDYTPASWAPFKEALTNAKEVLDDANATQTEVDNALEALQTAKAGLVEAADKTDLQNEITDVEDEMSALNKDDYTADSWEALEEALANAKEVLADENATQDDVEAAEEALKTAKDNLEPVEDQPGTVDKEDLEKEITEVEDEMSGLNKDDYTADSWEALEEALANAKEVLADPDATQDDVEAAEEALKTAKDNLEPASDTPEPTPTVDKEDLEKEIAEAEDEMSGLNKDDYTADSWEALEEALANAKEVLADENATQEDVEAAEEALKTAKDNLEPVKSDYTGFVKDGDKAYYMENGVITGKKQGIIKDANNALGDAGAWYYVIDSEVQYGFTGLSNFSNENGWWYIKSGKVDFTRNSVDQNKNGWWYVEGGKVQFGYTGVSNYSNANGWWYIKSGKVDFSRFSVDQNKNGWWYVTGGKVQFGYTGVSNYSNANGWWYIKSGKVDFTRNSVDQNKNGWWYVTGGKVQFGYTGVANYKNANGWWYIKEGKVDFTYTGRASNRNGTWNVAYGKVVF